MKEKNTPKHGVWHELKKISIWVLMLLGGTVFISVAYKVLIESDVFQLLIRNVSLLQFVFCIFELLLLLAYWYGIYRFSMECRRRSRSLKVYYIRISVAFAVFAALYWASFFAFGRDVFMWVFRMTVNLICFRFVTVSPDNLIPYMIAFNVITFAIMMVEPLIAKARFEAREKMMQKIMNAE